MKNYRVDVPFKTLNWCGIKAKNKIAAKETVLKLAAGFFHPKSPIGNIDKGKIVITEMKKLQIKPKNENEKSNN